MSLEWINSGALGDAYNDCMGSCVDQCNNAGFEPVALQACIAACPSTCSLYKALHDAQQKRQHGYQFNEPMTYGPARPVSSSPVRHWKIYVWGPGAVTSPKVSDVYQDQLQVQQHIRNVWVATVNSVPKTPGPLPSSYYSTKVQAVPAPNTPIPAGGAYGFETTDGQHVSVLPAPTQTAHVGPVGPVRAVHGIPEEVKMSVEWINEEKNLGAVEWVADGTLGDAYNDCMGSCIDQCNNAGFTEPGALQACIAACPSTCLLYKVPAGGTPNKPNACMKQCLADANSLSDPTAKTAAIAACPATCALQGAATCPPGTLKDASGKCSPPAGIGCGKDSDCKDGQECVQGLCVDKCPAGQVRASDGTCAAAAPTASSSGSSWGLAALGLGAAAAIFFGLRAPSMTAADKAHAQRYKELEENPWMGEPHRSRRRRHRYEILVHEPARGGWHAHWIVAARATTKPDAEHKRDLLKRRGHKTKIVQRAA